jgi:hypothetical protein
MSWLFSPPSVDDLVHILKAWRFWLLGALAGALLGWAVYALVPPPFRARATVLVDFNLEQAWPKETDRQQFYYLERETRKLEEIAWSDAVLENVAVGSGLPVSELRSGKLLLSQPADAGWRFYAEDADADRAAALAGGWAVSFVQAVESAQQSGQPISLNEYVQAAVVQEENLPTARRSPLSVYLLAGASIFLVVGFFAFLLGNFGRPRLSVKEKKQA